MRFSTIKAPAALLVVALALSGCTAGGGSGPSNAAASASESAPAVELTSNVKDGAVDVAVDTIVSVGIAHGSFDAVSLTDAEGKVVKGTMGRDAWTADQRLEPGGSYTLAAEATNVDGESQRLQQTFTARALAKDEQIYPYVQPLQGETVGVGMPVVVHFDLPVKDRKLYEQHMQVTNSRNVPGRWHWFSDYDVRYRPEKYWPANTTVNVKLDLNSLPAGNGLYGQQDQDVSFTVGDATVSTVDLASHTMTVETNGKVVNTLPITGGDAQHQTRNGIKVIMSKQDSVDMDAASTGVSESAEDYYNISDVKYAMRLTNSGEFIHAAPWSVGSQGRANVSHGCTGLSMSNAAWLYNHSKRGDVVKYVGSNRPWENDNGWMEWNLSWSDWVAGSALPTEAPSASARPSATPVPDAA